MRDTDEVSTDAFLGGLVRLLQPLRGHRAGLDAALLQAAVPADASGRAADLGCGTGAVAFSVAARAKAMSVIGVERDEVLVALARRALDLPENAPIRERVTIVEHAIGTGGHAGLPLSGLDWVLMNPPYDSPGRVSASPHSGKRSAYLAEADGLAEWVRFAARLLRSGGHLALIHRAEAIAEIVTALAPAFGEVQIRPVHPRADAAAKRIMLRASRGRRTKPRLLPPLVLHPSEAASDRQWSEEAEALLTGAANMTWL